MWARSTDGDWLNMDHVVSIERDEPDSDEPEGNYTVVTLVTGEKIRYDGTTPDGIMALALNQHALLLETDRRPYGLMLDSVWLAEIMEKARSEER